ncbi:Heterokaryon incompatibility protein 6, OR allele [Colletotrichum sp. SAR 10_76]|nr:Heterokaryon incompatibility protein 6, OR allele [Colletotrichum sp. SAR 10_76]
MEEYLRNAQIPEYSDEEGGSGPLEDLGDISAEDTSVEDGENHIDQQEEEPEFDPVAAGLKEISNLGKFTVSSHKQGNGVDQLRHDSLKSYWQSDGPQPHKLTVYFIKRVGIRDIRFYVDYNEDESYTPTKIIFKSGTSENNLIQFATMDLSAPSGWQLVPIAGSGGGPDGNTLVSYVFQMQILENHQNGKDTHLRSIKIYAADTDGANVERERDSNNVSVHSDLTMDDVAADERPADPWDISVLEAGLPIPDFMKEPEIRTEVCDTQHPATMDQDASYRYQPLPPVVEQNRPPPFTRLLLLKPGSAEDPFEAHLELVHIEQAPPYEALSYTWGKPTEQPRDYIWLDGHPLPIKPNLEDALRSLRFPNQARRLWVDALCIDQSNLDERARQVQYMRLVYKHAARVVVWLGLKTSGTHEALQAAERIARLREYTDPARSGADSAPPDSDTLQALVSSMMEDIPESAMTNLDEVFQRPYFTRCWCVQEIVASSWAIAKIEDLEMSFFDLIASSLFLVQLKQEVAVNAPWELWNNILMVRQPNHPVYQTEVQGSLGGFLHLLELTRTFQATDDRDRIFSLLGICDEGINPILALTATASGQVSWRGRLVRRGLKRISDFINEFHPQGTFGTPKALMPDYKRETVAVYCDLARFLLRKTPRVLDVLDHVSHNEEPGTGEYPSWVPKWFEERTCLVFRGVFFTGFYSKGRTDPYLADLHDIPAVAEPVRPRVLSVDGYHVDVVDRMSDVFEFVSGSRLAGFAVIKAWFDLYGLPINPRRGTLYRDGSLLDMAFCKAVLSSFFGASIGSNYSSMMQYGGFSMALDQSLFGSVEEIKQDTLVKDLSENFLAFTTFLAESGAVQESFGNPERDRKLGEIKTNYEAEQALIGSAPEVVFVRCAYFMENWAAALETAKSEKRHFHSVISPADYKIPMVSVHDIGKTCAAQALAAGSPLGENPYVFDLHGPDTYSTEDVRMVFEGRIGTAVEAKLVEGVQLEEFFGEIFRPPMAGMFVEMTKSFLPGGVAVEEIVEGSRVQRGKTTLSEAVERMMGGNG